MIAPLKLALSSGPGNGAGAGMRYVAGLVLFTVPSCVTRGAALLTCSSAALGSRSRDHTQEIASSFPVPFVSFSRSSHFVFLPLPFSLLPSLSLLFAPDIYPLVPPWAVGSASQANQAAFFSCPLPAARLAVGPSHSDVSYGQNRRPSAPPWVRDSLALSLASTAPARLSIESDDAPAAQLCSALPARLFNSSATLAVVALPPVTMQTVPSVSLLTFSDGTRHT